MQSTDFHSVTGLVSIIAFLFRKNLTGFDILEGHLDGLTKTVLYNGLLSVNLFFLNCINAIFS